MIMEEPLVKSLHKKISFFAGLNKIRPFSQNNIKNKKKHESNTMEHRMNKTDNKWRSNGPYNWANMKKLIINRANIEEFNHYNFLSIKGLSKKPPKIYRVNKDMINLG